MSCAETAEPIDSPFGMWTSVGQRKHKFNRIHQVAPMYPMTLCRELCKNSWTDQFAIWVVDSGRPKEAQVKSYLPGGANVPTWEGTLAPPGEYDWIVHLRRRCGLMSNYFDHLLSLCPQLGWSACLLNGYPVPTSWRQLRGSSVWRALYCTIQHVAASWHTSVCRSVRVWVMMIVNTACDRLLSLFMLVAATVRDLLPSHIKLSMSCKQTNTYHSCTYTDHMATGPTDHLLWTVNWPHVHSQLTTHCEPSTDHTCTLNWPPTMNRQLTTRPLSTDHLLWTMQTSLPNRSVDNWRTTQHSQHYTNITVTPTIKWRLKLLIKDKEVRIRASVHVS